MVAAGCAVEGVGDGDVELAGCGLAACAAGVWGAVEVGVDELGAVVGRAAVAA